MNKQNQAIGKFHKQTEKSSPFLIVTNEVRSKEEEIRFRKNLRDRGFKLGEPFKTETGEVLLSGRFFLERDSIPEDIGSALNGKNVYFNGSYIKGIEKCNFTAFNNVSDNNTSFVRVDKNKEGKVVANFFGNLHISEKENGKKSLFISQSIPIINKEGEEWKESTVQKYIETAKAWGLNAKVGVSKDNKKFLNVSASVYIAKTSDMYENKDLEKGIKDNSPFVAIQAPLQKLLNGQTLTVNKNGNLIPLGKDSENVFKGFKTMEYEKKEDLYSDVSIPSSQPEKKYEEDSELRF